MLHNFIYEQDTQTDWDTTNTLRTAMKIFIPTKEASAWTNLWSPCCPSRPSGFSKISPELHRNLRRHPLWWQCPLLYSPTQTWPWSWRQFLSPDESKKWYLLIHSVLAAPQTIIIIIIRNTVILFLYSWTANLLDFFHFRWYLPFNLYSQNSSNSQKTYSCHYHYY